MFSYVVLISERKLLYIKGENGAITQHPPILICQYSKNCIHYHLFQESQKYFTRSIFKSTVNRYRVPAASSEAGPEAFDKSLSEHTIQTAVYVTAATIDMGVIYRQIVPSMRLTLQTVSVNYNIIKKQQLRWTCRLVLLKGQKTL